MGTRYFSSDSTVFKSKRDGCLITRPDAKQLQKRWMRNIINDGVEASARKSQARFQIIQISRFFKIFLILHYTFQRFSILHWFHFAKLSDIALITLFKAAQYYIDYIFKAV